MRFFNLSLQWRLVLAAFSGLLTYPANLLDSALGPDWYPPILSWWLILHGLLFGALVMAPYVLRKDHRVLRVAALMLGSVMIYYTAIEVPGLVKIAFLGDTGPHMIAGVTGALLVAVSTRVIAPLSVTPGYWAMSLLAGMLGGFLFSLTFEICPWDACSPPWKILPFTSGWIVWQGLICAAMFLGLRRDDASRPQRTVVTGGACAERHRCLDEVTLHEIDTDFA